MGRTAGWLLFYEKKVLDYGCGSSHLAALAPEKGGDPRMWGGPQGGYCRIIYLFFISKNSRSDPDNAGAMGNGQFPV